MNPEKTEERAQALALIEQGVPPKTAARQVGIAEITVRRALASLAREASVAHERGEAPREQVQEGLQIRREHLLSKLTERFEVAIDSVKPGELRDLAVALGILDDKVAGRGMGGVSVQNVNQVIVKTEWPEP